MKHVRAFAAPITAVLGVSFVVAGARGQTASLAPVADATLFESSAGSLASGAGSALFVGRTGQATGSIRRGLVRFDLAAAIPAGATITGVTIRLWNSAPNTQPESITLHRALESWGEGTSVSSGGGGGGAPATTGDATWTFRSFNTLSWTTPGGVFTAAPSATTSVAGTAFWEWTSAGLIADAQAFLDNPAQNFGWLLRGNESSASTAKRFATREEPDSSLRPALIVTYVPAPSAGAILALGMIAGARRRRSA